MGEWIICFTDISTQEACMVTQELDLDQMSERSICILKDRYIIYEANEANICNKSD